MDLDKKLNFVFPGDENYQFQPFTNSSEEYSHRFHLE